MCTYVVHGDTIIDEATETTIIKKIAEIEEKVTELRQKVQIIVICVVGFVGLAVITLAMITF